MFQLSTKVQGLFLMLVCPLAVYAADVGGSDGVAGHWLSIHWIPILVLILLGAMTGWAFFYSLRQRVALSTERLVEEIEERRLAEETLRIREKRDRAFQARLTTLHVVTNQISQAVTETELCRHAVEYGRNVLHFERISIWMFKGVGKSGRLEVQGTFGVDEEGHFVDERGAELIIDENTTMARVLNNHVSSVLEKDVELINKHSACLGKGDRIIAALWDGSRVIGVVSVDNLIEHTELDRRKAKLLEMYAASLGHLISLKRAEAELRQSETRFRTLFEQMHAAFSLNEIICDESGRPVDYRHLEINPVFEDVTGLRRDDVVGRTVLEVLPETDPFWIETYGRVALTGEAAHFEHYSRSLSKYLRVTAFSPRTHQFAIVLEDITEHKNAEKERKELEQQVQHAQKLESLGILAGGMAHDFNNLLVGVLGNADLILTLSDKEMPYRNEVQEIKRSALRAADLTHQMLAYSGKGHFVVKAIDLNDLIEDMTSLLEVSISKKILLKRDFMPDLPLIEGDAAQIRQVVMNLITNASDAIGAHSGVVKLRTETVEMAEDHAVTELYSDTLLPGRYVLLTVQDSGAGMNAETQAKLFDPFFTTKRTGRGLGLAAVQGIVRGHKGRIEVSSKLGTGSTFKVWFPVAKDAGRPEEAVPEKDYTPSPQERKGEGTILVVDDEEAVCMVAKLVLEGKGFFVLTASDGQMGVDVFSEHVDDIRAVVLDMTMPRLNGLEAFRRMRQIKPDIPVLLSSGYTEEDAMARFGHEGLSAFLQKPYEVTAFLEHVFKVLDA